MTAQHLALYPHPVSRKEMDETERNLLPLREIVKRHTLSVEREVIAHTLRRARGNKAEAARLLQVDYKTIHSKLKEYRIESNGEPYHDQEK